MTWIVFGLLVWILLLAPAGTLVLGWAIAHGERQADEESFRYHPGDRL